jgi:hypothetical protein
VSKTRLESQVWRKCCQTFSTGFNSGARNGRKMSVMFFGVMRLPVACQPARSSFTFEIKRANRRADEDLTGNKVASGLSLADQVFGKTATGATARTTSVIESPTPVPGIDLFKTTSRPIRRILPDLLTTLIDPVEERAKLEAEEKARRRASRTVEVKATRLSEPNAVTAAVLVVEAAREEHASHQSRESVRPPRNPTETVEKAVSTSDSRKGKSLKAAAMRAERTGRPLPQLPAGQRWKRRLPKVCW